MTPEEEPWRVGYALIRLLTALGDHGRLVGLGLNYRVRWYVAVESDRLRAPLWPRMLLYVDRPSLADALDDMSARVEAREARRRS